MRAEVTEFHAPSIEKIDSCVSTGALPDSFCVQRGMESSCCDASQYSSGITSRSATLGWTPVGSVARPGIPAPRRDSPAGAGDHKPRRGFGGEDGVTKHGTVVHRLGGTTVRDDGKVLHVAGHTDAAGLQAALRMAQSLYGSRIHVYGSVAFKEAVVQAAVAGAMPLVFDDVTLEQHRQQLSRTALPRENRHEQSSHAIGRPTTGRVCSGPMGRSSRQGKRAEDGHPRRPPLQEASTSPTLARLDATRRPSASTVSERCPNSVWFASATEVKCYCRVMYLLTWNSREPQPLTSRDGVLLGQQE